MVRTSLLSLALLVLAGVAASPAETPKASDREGFRVYSIGPRCGNLFLQGTYESPREALRTVAGLRVKTPGQEFVVTTGSEGKRQLTRSVRPALYQVYTKNCDKEGWQRNVILVDAKRVEEAVKAHKGKGTQVEVINDYAPKEVFHVYGGGCSRSWQLRGTYLTVREASDAAQLLRTNDKYRCDVTTGTARPISPFSPPTQYKVYSQGCKSGWSLVATTNDLKKAQTIFEARKKGDSRAELVKVYTGK